MNDVLASLNAEQLLAVKTTEGYVRVMAGAGTGKTKALTTRYCYLVSELGISPSNILTVTFTNRAANEMKARVRASLGDVDLGLISTIHAFCARFLKDEIHLLNYPKRFIILDTEDEREMLLQIFTDMKITLRDTTLQHTIDQVLEAKKMTADSYIDELLHLTDENLQEKINLEGERNDQIFLRYLYEQKKCFGLDFNDLINFTTYILENFPEVAAKWQNKMQYVQVDEFQDVSEKQYKIAQILSQKHRNLFIVGDSDQTIYSWRGSHVRLFLDFDKKYPASKTIILKENYRSTPQILSAANELISHNVIRFPKELHAVCASGEKPLYFHGKNSKEESLWIAEMIESLVKRGVSLANIAILYRAHFLSRAIEECLIQKRIPYRILSGISFYARKEIKDVVCYLRMLTAQDDIAFLRTINVPGRKIGKKKLEMLKEYAHANRVSLFEALLENLDSAFFKGTGAAKYANAILTTRKNLAEKKLDDVLQQIMDLSGYGEFIRLEADQDRLDNIAEFKRTIETASKDPDANLDDFLSKIALYGNLDKEERENAVKLLSIHSAKGLEFPYVFITGLNEGVFPSAQVETPEEMEEERRIAYVAFTRAKKQLFITENENGEGAGICKYPSRFIFEAGESNLTLVRPLPETLKQKALAKILEDIDRMNLLSNLFFVGDNILHPVFGKGTIVSIDSAASSYIVKFDSLETPRNIQFTAKIQRLQGETA
ncbi:MAG: UvrD-helicase domain-containing protein [Fibrobacteraceae bacterium]|nr:UvrD-helicase domain-containing protein [Fibrobacteraceae bacterium]